MDRPTNIRKFPEPSKFGLFLCWLGFHKQMFSYKSRPTDEMERRVVEVVCFRCGEILDRQMELIDNDGNVG
jgi:hypothetical protein